MSIDRPLRGRASSGQRWDVLGLLVLALAVRLLVAWPLQNPGYTDAYYYAVGARQLDSGQGLAEPFIWNYLDPPADLPQPGYLYWMPLAAILGWLGMLALGPSLQAIQAPFVLLSALLPLVAYGIAWDLTGRRRHALLAGGLAVFPGFYAHVLVLPDNFAPFALAASICLWAAGRGLRSGHPGWLGLAGLAAGLGHLSRADGPLLMLVALAAAAGLAWRPAAVAGLASPQAPEGAPLGASGGRRPVDRRLRTAGLAIALALGGYLAVMTPWFARNWQAFGTPLPGAGLNTLFLTNYDDLFAYGRSPTLQGYLAWGWPAILGSKLDALRVNLLRLWVENLLIVLLPFTLLGLWQMRRDRLLWPFFLYAPALFVAMTLFFTFPGMRGGLFHSAGALLPVLFTAAGPGLEAVLRAVARRLPRWEAGRAWPVFAAGLLAIAVLVTGVALWRAEVPTGGWAGRGQSYAALGNWLHHNGVPDGTVVMAGNAPGWTWETGYPAIAVPNEPLDTILMVAWRYEARYLVLDDARPRTTDALYAGTAGHPALALRHVIDRGGQSWQLYEILPALPTAWRPTGAGSTTFE